MKGSRKRADKLHVHSIGLWSLRSYRVAIRHKIVAFTEPRDFYLHASWPSFSPLFLLRSPYLSRRLLPASPSFSFSGAHPFHPCFSQLLLGSPSLSPLFLPASPSQELILFRVTHSRCSVHVCGMNWCVASRARGLP